MPWTFCQQCHALMWQLVKISYPQACKTSGIQVTIDLGEGFTPTCMAHPDTYLNKVVVASQQGTMQLWNFSKGTRLYEFKVADCAIKCLAPSPALDVVGIGLADGCALSSQYAWVVLILSCHGSAT